MTLTPPPQRHLRMICFALLHLSPMPAYELAGGWGRQGPSSLWGPGRAAGTVGGRQRLRMLGTVCYPLISACCPSLSRSHGRCWAPCSATRPPTLGAWDPQHSGPWGTANGMGRASGQSKNPSSGQAVILLQPSPLARHPVGCRGSSGPSPNGVPQRRCATAGGRVERKALHHQLACWPSCSADVCSQNACSCTAATPSPALLCPS